MIVINSFTYVGPNRRSDMPVHEMSLVLTPAQNDFLNKIHTRLPLILNQLLALLNIAVKPALDSEKAYEKNTLRGLASLFCKTALHIQRNAGHLVDEFGHADDNKLADIQFYFEFDDPIVVAEVAGFCVKVFNALLDDNQPLDLAAVSGQLKPELDALIAAAVPMATPADTQAILRAAKLRSIPWLKLEKTTFEYHQGDFRLRKNSLINLGYGHHRKMVDSTFCVDKSFACFDLIRDREKMTKQLSSLGIPIPESDLELGARNSVMRIARSAERIGYPVALKSTVRLDGSDTITYVRERVSLEKSASTLLDRTRSVMVERFVAGKQYRIIVANLRIQGILVAGEDGNGRSWVTTGNNIHQDNLDVIAKIARYFPVGILEIRLVSEDISRSIYEVNGAVVDVKLAPELDDLNSDHPELLKNIALAFVDWMFPDPAAARIPIIAVTGTNGKTSTCRMIDSAFRKAGYKTGLACTDAIYIGSERITAGDFAGFPGHLTVLNALAVDAAILETARGGAVQRGLGFDSCDVSVCLNVTEDHLGEFGINTIEDMTTLKTSVVARASRAVVLNADNPQSLSMRTKLNGRKICLVSREKHITDLRERYPDVNCFAVIEIYEGAPWVIVHDDIRALPIIGLADIPATWNGAANHYVSNALHAIAACYLSNLPQQAIQEALSEFRLSYDIAPGRLNIHQGGGITVIMDFAQNPDSLRELINFSKIFPVPGKKIIGLSCSAKNSDAVIRETARTAAGEFDHYMCKNFKYSDIRPANEVPRLLSEGLLSGGVDRSIITLIEDPLLAVESIIGMAREGDLIVLMTGGVHREETWKYITTHIR